MGGVGRTRARRLAATIVVIGGCSFDSSGGGQSGATIGETSSSSSSAGVGSTGDASEGPAPTSEDTSATASADDETAGSTGATPGSWWNAAWTKRRRIALALPARVDEPLADVPVPIFLDDNRIAYGELQTRAQDLRFVDADDELVLDHEIERWTPDGRSVAWVRVPMLGDLPDDGIYMYWGSADAPDGQNAAGVWGSDYAGVWHLDDDPAAAAPQVVDSSAAQLDGTLGGGMDASALVEARIGRGLAFDGEDDVVGIGSVDTDDWSAVTMSAWLLHTDTGDDRVLSKADGVQGNDHVLMLGVANDNAKVRVRTDGKGGNSVELQPENTVPLEHWTHLAVTWSAGGDMTLYVDGDAVAAETLGGDSLADLDADLLLANAAMGEDRHYAGTLDEVRLERTARSAAWILVQYAAMNDDLATFGPEELAP